MALTTTTTKTVEYNEAGLVVKETVVVVSENTEEVKD